MVSKKLDAYMQKKFIGKISYGVYLQPLIGSSGGPWKFPRKMALQLGTGGPVERSFGLPTWTGGPGGGGACALAIGTEVIVVGKVAIKTPTMTNTVKKVKLLLVFIFLF